MYPVLFRLGSFEVTSFGMMVGLGVLVGVWMFRRELVANDLPPGALDGALAGVVGGLVGAKLLWTVEHFGDAPLTELLFSRGGLSWFGGFAGGVGTAFVIFAARRYKILPLVAASTPALAVGQAMGRIGCLLVGDDYGRPTDLPWGIAFPQGLPPTTERVHPTQIYEAIALVVIAATLIRWRRRGMTSAHLLGWYLVLAGAVRFAIEFIRIDERILFGLSVAHLASLGIMGAGLLLLGKRGTLAPASKSRSVGK
jgi:phosphatidylglycerol---prolipoprotein diacylglyceryl transferase